MLPVASIIEWLTVKSVAVMYKLYDVKAVWMDFHGLLSLSSVTVYKGMIH